MLWLMDLRKSADGAMQAGWWRASGEFKTKCLRMICIGALMVVVALDCGQSAPLVIVFAPQVGLHCGVLVRWLATSSLASQVGLRYLFVCRLVIIEFDRQVELHWSRLVRRLVAATNALSRAQRGWGGASKAP